jgi:hypothetical protein
MPEINGQSFAVSVDGENRCVDFQQQLAAAAAADTSLNHQVVIPAGATCYGEFTLPKKAGPGVVVIRPSTPDSELPPPGSRVDPSYRSRMAAISVPPVAASMGQAVRPALKTPACPSGTCTEGWRLIAIEITHPRHDQIEPIVRNIVSIEGKNPKLTLDQPHGLRHFNRVHVAGVEGMTGVNGTWQISVTGNDSFRLVGAEASGTYSGGAYIVHAMSSRIVDCTNASPIVCTTATRHGLNHPAAMEIQSIDGAEITLPANRNLRQHQTVEIGGSSSAAHNGVWAIEKASSNRARLKNGPAGRCTANCGTISMRRTVEVAGVEGNTAANGSHLIRVLSDTQIALLDASGNGSYTQGGFLSRDPDMFFNLLVFARGSSRMVLDRCYLHGQGFPTRIYFAFNLESNDSAVVDSYLEEVNFWGPVNPLSRAIEPGGIGASIITLGNGHRLKLSNNAFVNSPGIPVFTQEFRDGPDMAPTDIEITRNLFYNSDRFRAGSPESDGRHYSTSHILEFKKGQRILIDGNVFDGNWADRTPTGPAVIFSPRGVARYTDNVISDVTLTNNVFRRVSHALYVIGHEGRKDLATDPSARFRISNNLFEQVDYWRMHSEPSLFAGPDLSSGTGAGGSALWIFGTVEDLEFTHNTVLDLRGPSPSFVSFNYGRSSGVVIKHNIFPHNHDMHKGGVSDASVLDWATPPITGSPSEVFKQYFQHAPDPDPNSTFADNIVIPGVRGTRDPKRFDNPAAGANFSKADCEAFYRGFANVTCAGTGQSGETANQRLRSVFSTPQGYRANASLAEKAGVNVQALEEALGMTVDESRRAGERAETSLGVAALTAADSVASSESLSRSAAGIAGLRKPLAVECGRSPCAEADPSFLRNLMAHAGCGDRVELSAGKTLLVEEPVSLAGIDCPPDNPLIVRASGWDLPAGVRVTPAQSPRMARLEARGFPGTIFTSGGAPVRGIVLQGLELVGSDMPQAGPLLRFEGAADIRVEQCYVHGRNSVPSGPAVILSGDRLGVMNSFIEGFWATASGPDASTLIVGGPGTVEFSNNYIEAATTALTVRGETSVQFRYNAVHRPFSHSRCWNEWDAVYRSSGNLMEIESATTGTFEYNLLEEGGGPLPPAAVALSLPSSVIFRANTFRNVQNAFRIKPPAAAIQMAATGIGLPRAVIEDNLLEAGRADAAATVCETVASPALLDQNDLRALPAGSLSFARNTTLYPRSARTASDVWPQTAEDFGGHTSARILNLQTSSRGAEVLFQYAVSAPSSGVPCTLELWPPARPLESVSAFDNLRGPTRAATVFVPPGARHEYRLMCGGDLQRGVIP